MALDLTGALGDVSNLASSVSLQDIAGTLLAGAAGTVVLSGLKSQAGLDAIDPLHIIHKPAQPATDTTPATPAATSVVQGPGVMTMSKFMALTADQQKMIQMMGYTIVPG